MELNIINNSKQVLSLLLFFLVSGCSLNPFVSSDESISPEFEDYKLYTSVDYKGQLNSYADFFINNGETQVFKVSSRSQTYLLRMIQQIMGQNELFFNFKKQGKVTVIDSNYPYHFSLPNHQVFISTGLIKKYIKHESLLAAILSYELVRSDKLIYNKRIIVPVGYLELKRIIKLLTIPLQEKVEVHKWAFHLMRRAGFDEDQYLAWIQIQNRNSNDFLTHLDGDMGIIAREETLFKNFIIKNKLKVVKRQERSSKSFYSFIKEFRKRNI